MTTTPGGPTPLSALGLAVPSAASRLRACLHRADQRFVAEVVRDGGIGPWRERLDARFGAARTAVRDSRLSSAETASLVVALADLPTRDRCWARVEIDGPAGWLPLWRHLLRHALRPYRTEVLFLFAWTAWRQESEPLARVAVDVLLTEEPIHVAGGMLATLLHGGVESSSVPPLVVRNGDRVSSIEVLP